MLVLARKVGESVVIGDNVEITVLEVKGEVVRLGVKAPSNIPVYRKEIYEQIVKENLASSSSELSLEDLSDLIKPASEEK